jgi:hypothetical protein
VKTKIPDLYADPFGEHSVAGLKRELPLLGAHFVFESNSAALLRLVDAAYAGMPRHRLARTGPRLRIRLQLLPEGPVRGEPSPLHMLSGGGLLGGATDSSNFVVLSPNEQSALVVVSARMLRFPYHVRYELIEFAVFTLAARSQGLVSMHGACVGHAGRGVLLMGPSGAGKSTVTLQCLVEGLSFLSEDAVFVAPESLLATGVPNFLHVRTDSVAWAGWKKIRNSPVIRRRSGVRKYEVDLRTAGYEIARRALQIQAVVFLSARKGTAGVCLSRAEGLRRLVAEQAYAVGQPSWPVFARNIGKLPFWELRRGQHPSESVAAICDIIG